MKLEHCRQQRSGTTRHAVVAFGGGSTGILASTCECASTPRGPPLPSSDSCPFSLIVAPGFPFPAGCPSTPTPPSRAPPRPQGAGSQNSVVRALECRLPGLELISLGCFKIHASIFLPRMPIEIVYLYVQLDL